MSIAGWDCPPPRSFSVCGNVLGPSCVTAIVAGKELWSMPLGADASCISGSVPADTPTTTWSLNQFVPSAAVKAGAGGVSFGAEGSPVADRSTTTGSLEPDQSLTG